MATAKLFLDARNSGDDSRKLLPVKISINHRSSSSYIATSVKILASQWNNKLKCIKDHPQKALLNKELLVQLTNVNNIIYEIMVSNDIKDMTCTQLCNAIKERINPSTSKQKITADNIKLVFERYIKNQVYNEGTRGLYLATLNKIKLFTGNKFETTTLSDITFVWLETFEKFLSDCGCAVNTRAGHLRLLRAIINYAYKQDLISTYVFKKFTIKTQKTMKRSMSVEALRRIIFTDLKPEMEKYRDFFVLSFMLRGLNTVDLCALPKPINGRIEWMRTKTNQPLSLKIEPEMLPYIDRWAGEKLLLCHCDTGRNYRYFNMVLSYNLHNIVKYINYKYQDDIVVPDITMYWGRHSWATIASSLHIPLDTIGIGLGHAQHSVTEIYVERDPAFIDEANRAVLDWVLYGKKNGVVVEQVDLTNYRVGDCSRSSETKTKRKKGRPKKEWRA